MPEAEELGRKGALSNHQRSGKFYLPPMAEVPINVVDSLKGEAPDFIWPIALWSEGGDGRLRELCRLQEEVSDRLTQSVELGSSSPPLRLDGKLSTLELWDTESREAHRTFLVERVETRGLVSDSFLVLLRAYSSVPGSWLLLEPWANRIPDTEPADALAMLAKGIAEWAKVGHLNALAKYLTYTWDAFRGSLNVSAEILEYLRDYPAVDAKRAAAETVIRAGYGSREAALAHKEDPSVEVASDWACEFWATNWRLTACLTADEVGGDAAQSDVEADGKFDLENSVARGLGTEIIDNQLLSHADKDQIDRLLNVAEGELVRFGDAYFGASDRNLLDTQLDEVVAGLTMRAVRAVASVVQAPHQWSSEFSATTFRLLAETEILLAWLKLHPQDAATFQAFGKGREKLAWLHVEDVIDSFGGEKPEELNDVAEQLRKRKREADLLDVTVVSVEATFNGVSMRKMAEETGFAELYRTVYQSSSGVLHGEWPSVESFHMTACLNPLHHFHMVPSLQSPWVEDECVPSIMLGTLERIVSQAVAVIDPT
ncbi:DUF5677 domain-containing protein [Mycobacterium sp. 852002-40037_SCH5390672]|uniref:DUF5677 domain-containing protein n=1 Tax=Mycobacterium sp. 852002-40037_SCH5390672 TaxID=1834089 RepID=UPI000AFD1852|nr:DUF5677 domain-containing protein [Mycobacterium sp. 852002-40037_SCH5390672]